ncbi:MAG: HNH endonuclease [Sedimentisphaerales bacterium]|nr:HNH endonuclease [Sedimentisphaerales bacterium]
MKLRLTIPVPDWLDRICSWPVLIYRKIRYGKTYRLIHLTEGYYSKVDQRDFYDLNKYEWLLQENNGCLHAVRFNNFTDTHPRILAMHRVIMNAPKGKLVDHRNRDGLDNRSDNLRLATHSQNCQNRRKQKNASSKYLGVSYRKSDVRWIVRIMLNGENIYLGLFDNEIDAARAYDRAALKYYGEGAKLNFPREDYINEFPMTDGKD